MPTETQPAEVTLLADTLQRLNQSGELTAKQIENLLNLAERSAYSYYGGTDLRFAQFRTLFRHCGSVDVQRQFLSALADGTGWVHQHLEADKDINGDGTVDTADLLDGGIQANTHLAQLLTAARGEHKHGMRAIGPARAQQIKNAITHAIKTLLAIQEAVNFLEQGRTRKS